MISGLKGLLGAFTGIPGVRKGFQGAEEAFLCGSGVSGGFQKYVRGSQVVHNSFRSVSEGLMDLMEMSGAVKGIKSVSEDSSGNLSTSRGQGVSWNFL